MTIRFDNRVAIVTGAGNGLGRAHALLLASRGARVVVNDPGGAVDGKGGDHAAADKVAAEIKAAGGQAVANYDSVAEPASAANIVKTAVESFGTVDIVVNNAGVLRDKTFHNMTIEDFDFVVKVHFLGTAYVTHAAWPIMRAKAYGRVVVTSSNSGVCAGSSQPGGLDIRATLSAAVPVLTLPTSSRITLSPIPGTTTGEVTCTGIRPASAPRIGAARRPGSAPRAPRRR